MGEVQPRWANTARRLLAVALLGAAACAELVGAADAKRAVGPLPTRAVAGDANGAGPTYYAEVGPILAHRCVACHAPGAIAPFSLTSYAEVVPHLAALRDTVSVGTMPPWLLDDACAPYLNSSALGADEKQTLLDWVDTGAAEGTADAASAASVAAATPVPASVDLTVQMPQPYLPQVQPDEYRCFLLDWPETTQKYITQSGVLPGNPSIVHHVAVSVLAPADIAKYSGKDGSDGHPGFACGLGDEVTAQGVSGWRPGEPPLGPMPPDALVLGFPAAPGSKLLLQMHYHSEGALADLRPDQTKILFHLADQVAKVATRLSFANPVWAVVPKTMLIPAGASDAVHAYVADPNLLLTVGTKSVTRAPLALYGGSAHMHLRGTTFKLQIVHADGSAQCVLDVPHWDASWGASALLAAPMPLLKGDKLSLECHWNNTAANQPLANGVKEVPRDITWGEDRDDEMCVGSLVLGPP